MKQLLLTLLCVITIAGCNNTTEPVIPDAVTYASIEYMPIDTSIKYVYRDGGTDKVFRVYYEHNGILGYYKHIMNGKKFSYHEEYQLRQDNVNDFFITSIALLGNTYSSTAFGYNKDDKYTLMLKLEYDSLPKTYDTPYSTSVLNYQSELIVNNIRYKDIMVLTETSSLSGYYFQNKYYYAKGVGIIRLSITDNTFRTATMDLVRTYK